MCKSRMRTNIRTVQADTSTDDRNPYFFLGAMYSEIAGVKSEGTSWTVTLDLNNRSVEFKVDTGTDVTVVSDTIYCQEQDGLLRSSEHQLTGAGQEPVQVQAQFDGCLMWKGLESQQQVFVVKRLCQPLLGRPAIEALGIISLVQPVEVPRNSLSYAKAWAG